MGEVRVPDITGPTAPLCWALGPTMVRCDRRAGHEGAHTWEPVPVAPAADDLDAALAWADVYADRLKCSVGQVTPSQRMCVTLAAALREQTCATCRYHAAVTEPGGEMGDPDYTTLWCCVMPDSDTPIEVSKRGPACCNVLCDVMGNGCRAWARREP